MTPEEQPVVRRAVAAYKAKKAYEGPFKGTSADGVLDALRLYPMRWTALAAYVIYVAKGPGRGSR